MISRNNARIRKDKSVFPSQAGAPQAEQAHTADSDNGTWPYRPAPRLEAPALQVDESRAANPGSADSASTEAVPANTPGRDVPAPPVPGSLLGRLVHLAESAEAIGAAGPGNLVLDTHQSQNRAMVEVWRAYQEVVDVLSAITRSARLVEKGVCAASQLAAIDLLNDELAVVWAKWDSAHRKVIFRQVRLEEP